MALLLLIVSGRAASADTNEIKQLQAQCKQLIVGQSRLLEARPAVEKLLAITLRERPEAHPDTLVALHWAGYLAHQSGRYAEAVQTWEKSLAIQEKLPTKDPIWFPRTLNMLAGVYEDQFDFARAEAALKRALVLREKALGPDHPETAQIIRGMGRLYERMGEYAQAEFCFLRMLRIFETSSGGEAESNIAETLFRLGDLYLGIGDIDKAEPLLDRALEMNERLFGLGHSRTINSLSTVAEVRFCQDDLVAAETLSRRSLSLREAVDGPDAITLYWPLHQLAKIYRDQGRLREAEESLQRIIGILRQALGPGHPLFANALGTLGQLHERRGSYLQAQESYGQALELFDRHLGPTHRYATNLRRSLARVHLVLGQPELALLDADQILDGEERTCANVLSFTSERQRLVFQKERLSGQSYDLWATMGAVQPLARSILRTKAIVLDSLLEDRLLAEASGDAQLLRQRDELIRLKRQLAFHPSNKPSLESATKQSPPAHAPDIETLARQAESLEATLARSVNGLGRSRRAFSVRAEQVQEALPERAVLIEFLRYDHYLGKKEEETRYGALVMSRHDEPKWIALGDAESIERNLKLYQHLVRREQRDDSLIPLLRELYGQLWAPLFKVLPAGVEQAIVCPDAQLNFLSFATLLNSSNRFLGEEIVLSYVSSGRDLLAAGKPVPSSPHLLVWANPDFGESAVEPAPANQFASLESVAVMRELRGLNLRPLPGAEKEGLLLHERATSLGFAQSTLHLGRDATEAELARVQSPAVLHLATHGFVLPEAASTNARNNRGTTNPMLRSGLALAGARHTLEAWANGDTVAPENDGIVSAEEIGCLNLRDTQLVVLSACDTGLGEARAGEGVLGLRRGFIQAGAQSLLLTLWPVEDGRTAAFMSELYTVVVQTGNPAIALAEVQQKWLENLRAKKGPAEACRIAGPFILSFQGKPAAPSRNLVHASAR